MSLLNWPGAKIEKMAATAADVRNKRDKAYRYLSFAKKQLSGQGDEDIIYTHVYDSIRIACEAILLLNGGRVKSSVNGHHFITINEAGHLLAGDMENEFKRFQKMRQKRNSLEYGNLTSVSEAELAQMMEDDAKLLEKIDKLIAEYENK
jgi:uncharacterized protein (UPF0332 family)